LEDECKEERILELCQHIASYGIQCVIDLLCQVQINSTGGFATWLPHSIRNADKILVVLSPSYLKVCVMLLLSDHSQNFSYYLTKRCLFV